MSNVIKMGRHGLAGYYSLADLPQREPIKQARSSTGWWELDEIFQMYPGQFVVVTGRPGHGKSSFVMNVLINAWRSAQPMKSYMYVPENEQVVRDKLRAIYGDRDGFDEFSAAGCFVQSSAFEHYDDDKPKTMDWILERAFDAYERDGVRLVMIDPWNELERAKQKDELMTDYIGYCIMRLKTFCRYTGCTVFMIAHPTKAVNEHGGRGVNLADIEGSMAWANKCDNGLIVEREKGGNSTKVISAKVREQPDAGRLGVCHFQVDPETGRFTPQVGGVSP